MKKIILSLVIITVSTNVSGQKLDTSRAEKKIAFKVSTINQLKYTVTLIFDYLKKQPYGEAAPLVNQLAQLQSLVDEDIRSDSTRKK